MHYVPILCLISAISVPLLSGCESLYREQGSAPSEPVPTVMRAAQLDANVKRNPGATLEQATGSNASDKVVQAEPTIWDRMRSRFSLDLDRNDPRIQSQLNWYSRNQRYMDRTAQRAKRYLPYILNELEARDMPSELALLPLVESAYDPFAYSHGRASGLWQFIPSTGRAFGMGQNWWYDGRRDIVASTQGALSYLKQLSERFDGDYELALASYNAGGARVARAMRRNQRQGKPTDFWSLHLPRETRHYVPKLIALARIIKNPEAHGIDLPEISNDPYFEVVDIGGQMDLAQAADMAGVEVKEIYRLNPGFNRWATAPNGPHRLLIPAHASERFREALEQMPPEERVSWRNYTVDPGDTLIQIARQFNTTPDVIRANNKLRGNMIRQGQTLLIPVAGKSGNFYALSEQKRRQSRQAASGGSNQSRIDYRVTNGDTLWDIASAHDVSVRKLANWNSMAPGDPIKPGDKLAIWTASANAGKTLGDKRENMVRRVGYTVRSGDSLRRIANRFNVGVSEITQWNDLNMQDYLHPGQQLKLFVDIRNTH